MEYIVKNYSLNKTYFIDKQAINAIVKEIIKNASDVIVDSYETIINTKKNIFNIKISLWTKQIEHTTKTIKYLTKKVDAKCHSSLNIKPSNILVNIKGVK